MRKRRPCPGGAAGLRQTIADLPTTVARPPQVQDSLGLPAAQAPRCVCLNCILHTIGRVSIQIGRSRHEVARDMLAQLSMDIVEQLQSRQS
jgi:hypothetical protein